MKNEEINSNKSSVRSSRASSVPKPKSEKQNQNQENKNNLVYEKKFDYFGELLFDKNTTRSISDLLLANLIVFTAVFLSALIPIVNLALPFVVYMYLKTGLWGFVLNKESGKVYKYEDLFISLKKIIKIFCLATIKLFLILFWTILLIIPGIICMLNYSFTGIILYESPDLDVKGALMLSKELSYGYRWQIFFYQLLSIAIICVSMTLMFLLIMFFDIFMSVPGTMYIVFVTLSGFMSMILLACPMVQIATIDSYILSKKRKTDKI